METTDVFLPGYAVFTFMINPFCIHIAESNRARNPSLSIAVMFNMNYPKLRVTLT